MIQTADLELTEDFSLLFPFSIIQERPIAFGRSARCCHRRHRQERIHPPNELRSRSSLTIQERATQLPEAMLLHSPNNKSEADITKSAAINTHLTGGALPKLTQRYRALDSSPSIRQLVPEKILHFFPSSYEFNKLHKLTLIANFLGIT